MILLEAGAPWDVEKDGKMLTWNYDSPRRGRVPREALRRVRRLHRGLGPGGRALQRRRRDSLPLVPGAHAGWPHEPLGSDLAALRSLGLPGAQPRRVGDDWPIGYDDLKPYYDKRRRLVGLFGTNEGLPNDPDGIFLPPPAPRVYERLIQKASDSLVSAAFPPASRS